MSESNPFQTPITERRVPVGSEKNEAFMEVVIRLNEIFHEDWVIDDIGAALNSVSLIINTMSQELIDGQDSRQMRTIALQAALQIAPSAVSSRTAAGIVADASTIENYINKGTERTAATVLSTP